MFQFNSHSAQRAAQRNLKIIEIEYVITNGQCFNKAGAVIYFLRKRDIPETDQAENSLARLAGTAVILSKDEKTLLTVWRNRRNGLKRIRCKAESGRLPKTCTEELLH